MPVNAYHCAFKEEEFWMDWFMKMIFDSLSSSETIQNRSFGAFFCHYDLHYYNLWVICKISNYFLRIKDLGLYDQTFAFHFYSSAILLYWPWDWLLAASDELYASRLVVCLWTFIISYDMMHDVYIIFSEGSHLFLFGFGFHVCQRVLRLQMSNYLQLWNQLNCLSDYAEKKRGF